MPLRGLSRSMEVLLNMTKRMNRKMMTSLPTLSIGLTSMIRLGGASLEQRGDLDRCDASSTYSLTKAWHVDHDSFLLDIVGPVLNEGGEEPRKPPENRCGDQQSAKFLETQFYP